MFNLARDLLWVIGVSAVLTTLCGRGDAPAVKCWGSTAYNKNISICRASLLNLQLYIDLFVLGLVIPQISQTHSL